MGFRIVIAGESQCLEFSEICLVADFLSQNLPDFCYDRVEIPVLDWHVWLSNINLKNNWHHCRSPLVWKEMLMAGSKPYYIGGGSQFLDYCFSYYNFDSMFSSHKYDDVIKNIAQYKTKITAEQRIQNEEKLKEPGLKPTKKEFTFTISGVGYPLAMHLISGFLEMNLVDQVITKIFIHDDNCTEEFMFYLEKECSYIDGFSTNRIVKCVNKIGLALTSTDFLIILDHVPFDNTLTMGEWLDANKKLMDGLSLSINASGARNMFVIFPNLGPACYNATCLRSKVTIAKDHIVVATSDLGLEILPIAAEIANIPNKNIFCPPVWGFVGINHLVDIRTTVHRYDTFDPYNRYTKVKQSSLKIGTLTPELRTMEYLMFFDETLWKKVAETKTKYPSGQPWLNKSIAVLNLLKSWIFKADSNDIINLGVHCDGSFGLKFDGVFSQPARLVNGKWVAATDFLMPKDPNMSLKYLEQMAEWIMSVHDRKDLLPPIIPFMSCSCKPKYIKKKRDRQLY